jgi:hypothetical protein
MDIVAPLPHPSCILVLRYHNYHVYWCPVTTPIMYTGAPLPHLSWRLVPLPTLIIDTGAPLPHLSWILVPVTTPINTYHGYWGPARPLPHPFWVLVPRCNAYNGYWCSATTPIMDIGAPLPRLSSILVPHYHFITEIIQFWVKKKMFMIFYRHAKNKYGTMTGN